MTYAEWAVREREARQHLRVPAQRPVPLLPAERFSHRKPDSEIAAWITGGKTSAIESRLARSCAGWARRPTRTEFVEAIRTRKATTRQVAILSTWANEAHWSEHQRAWCEGAYTLRELVEGLHRAGLSTCRAARWLNHQTDR